MTKISRLFLSSALFATSLTASAEFGFGIPVFDKNSATLNEAAKAILADSATLLERWPDKKLKIYGSRGQLESDASVSSRRLESARKFLIEIGVNSEKILLEDVGTSRPLQPDCIHDAAPEECDRYNRNIQLQLVAP